MYNPDNYLALVVHGDLFRLLANCFLFFCTDLAVFILLALLADILTQLKVSTVSPTVGKVT